MSDKKRLLRPPTIKSRRRAAVVDGPTFFPGPTNVQKKDSGFTAGSSVPQFRIGTSPAPSTTTRLTVRKPMGMPRAVLHPSLSTTRPESKNADNSPFGTFVAPPDPGTAAGAGPTLGGNSDSNGGVDGRSVTLSNEISDPTSVSPLGDGNNSVDLFDPSTSSLAVASGGSDHLPVGPKFRRAVRGAFVATFIGFCVAALLFSVVYFVNDPAPKVRNLQVYYHSQSMFQDWCPAQCGSENRSCSTSSAQDAYGPPGDHEGSWDHYDNDTGLLFSYPLTISPELIPPVFPDGVLPLAVTVISLCPLVPPFPPLEFFGDEGVTFTTFDYAVFSSFSYETKERRTVLHRRQTSPALPTFDLDSDCFDICVFPAEFEIPVSGEFGRLPPCLLPVEGCPEPEPETPSPSPVPSPIGVLLPLPAPSPLPLSPTPTAPVPVVMSLVIFVCLLFFEINSCPF